MEYGYDISEGESPSHKQPIFGGCTSLAGAGDKKLRGRYCSENPKRLVTSVLKKRLCGDVPCEGCEVMCGFGREWLRRQRDAGK